MCRLAYIPKISDDIDIEELLKYLEISNGGDGNGIGGYRDGRPVIYKGAKTDIDILYKRVVNGDFERGFLFHTRWATSGSVNDYHTHPFRYYNTITCHNGSWDDKNMNQVKLWLVNKAKEDPKKIIPMNDSRTLAYIVGRWGIEEMIKWKNGVVLSMNKDSVKAYVNGSFESAKFGENYIYASEIPYKIAEKADEVKCFAHDSIVNLSHDGYKVEHGNQPYTYEPYDNSWILSYRGLSWNTCGKKKYYKQENLKYKYPYTSEYMGYI